ncbi:MAG: hypothetical protein ACR2JO_09890 [Mycobacteriales bacterium]
MSPASSKFAMVTLVAVAATAAMVACTGGETSLDGCSVPTATELADLSKDAAVVTQARFRSEANLTDGTTTTTGLIVVPIAALHGAAAVGEEVAVWPTQAEGTPTAGEQLVLFLRAHGAPTRAAGQSTPAYDITRAGAVLVESDTGVQRLCRYGRSRSVDRTLLDELRRQ